jgi:hypothetical protein
VNSVESQPTFRRNISPSWSKNNINKCFSTLKMVAIYCSETSVDFNGPRGFIRTLQLLLRSDKFWCFNWKRGEISRLLGWHLGFLRPCERGIITFEISTIHPEISIYGYKKWKIIITLQKRILSTIQLHLNKRV